MNQTETIGDGDRLFEGKVCGLCGSCDEEYWTRGDGLYHGFRYCFDCRAKFGAGPVSPEQRAAIDAEITRRLSLAAKAQAEKSPAPRCYGTMPSVLPETLPAGTRSTSGSKLPREARLVPCAKADHVSGYWYEIHSAYHWTPGFVDWSAVPLQSPPPPVGSADAATREDAGEKPRGDPLSVSAQPIGVGSQYVTLGDIRANCKHEIIDPFSETCRLCGASRHEIECRRPKSPLLGPPPESAVVDHATPSNDAERDRLIIGNNAALRDRRALVDLDRLAAHRRHLDQIKKELGRKVEARHPSDWDPSEGSESELRVTS